MTDLARFLVFNLIFSLAAGLLAWVIVTAAIRLLQIRSSAMSICFFSLPVVKSIFILLGVGLIFPWPAEWFLRWHSLALTFNQVFPVLLIWTAGIISIYLLIVRHARQAVLKEAQLAVEVEPRLAAAFETVLERFRKAPCPPCTDDLCCKVEMKVEPRLLVSKRINSPMALTEGGAPIILFPMPLVSRLTDLELAGALAHEMAHFHLRLPTWCSSGTLQKLTLISPVAGLVGEYLHRQEEKACDELAVSMVGQPELYAGMLTKSYRFAKEQPDLRTPSRLQVLPRLVGFKPLLSERVEHLIQGETTGKRLNRSKVVAWMVWAALVLILFTG